MRAVLNPCVAFLLVLLCIPGVVLGAEQEKSVRHHSHQNKSKSHRPDLTVAGSVKRADGIGKQSVDLISSLHGFATMSFLSKDKVNESELAACPQFVQKILARSGAKYPGKVLICEYILSWEPTNEKPKRKFWSHFKVPEKMKNQIRLSYTMFESSRAPGAWVHILNHSFDAAVVPDKFLVKVYKDSGVKIPIFVLPLGRDLKAFLNAPLKSSRGTPFIFANYSTWIPRKNFITLIRAFADAFGNSQDVQLQLCSRLSDKPVREAILSEIAAKGLTNVEIKDQGVDEETYVQRFLKVDCYVNIATGEGFSNQPREAMALGIPTIVTDNTGQKTICSSGLVRVVPSDIEVPAEYSFPGEFGVQYQCKTQDVTEALRDVYDHYDVYLQKGPKAREWAAQYDYNRMTPLYMSLIKPKRIVLGAENTILQDGIMTTSKKLVRKYKKIMKNQLAG